MTLGRGGLGFVVGIVAALCAPAVAHGNHAPSQLPPEAPEAGRQIEHLSSEQSAELAKGLGSLIGKLDFGDLPKLDLPSLDGSLPSVGVPSAQALPGAAAAPNAAIPGVAGLQQQLQDLVTNIQEVLDILTVRWETECNGVKKVHHGVMLVPQPLDVCGNPLADVTVQIVPALTLDGASMRIQRLLAAPSSMPLKIEAIIDLPGAQSAAVGYDTRESNAPSNFTENLALPAAGDDTQIDLNVTQAGAGPKLALLGEVFTPGPGTQRTKPTRVRLGYTPVPTQIGISVRTGAQSASALMTNNIPSVADLLFEDLSEPPKARRVTAHIDKLPGSLAVGLEQQGAQRKITYRANLPVSNITVGLRDTTDSHIDQDVALEADSVPTTIDVTQPNTTRTTVLANTPIGRVFGGFATNGEVRRLSDPAYLHSVVDGSFESLSAQVKGLKSATFDGGEPSSISATLAPGPFRALLLDGNRTLDAHVNDLPGQVALTLDAGLGRAMYSGNATINTLTVDANDPDGLAGRATDLDLKLTGVPSGLTLDFAQSGDSFGIDTAGSPLGQVEGLLSDGVTAPSLPTDQDGVVLRDTPSQYAVFARLTALRKASITQRPNIDFLLDTAPIPRRVAVVDLAQQATAGDPLQTVVGMVDKLAPNTHVTFAEEAGTGNRKLTYNADAGVNVVTVDANNLPLEGRARNARLRVEGLPSGFTLDLGNEGQANLQTSGGTVGLVEALLTSGPNETVPAGLDGVVFKDIASHYAIAARVTGLNRVSAAQNPLDLFLDATGNKKFRVEVRDQALSGGKETFSIATLDTLKRNTHIVMDDNANANAQQIQYSADGAANSLTFETNSGEPDPFTGEVRARMNASVAPLPASLSTCFATKPNSETDASNFCGNQSRNAGEGSFRIQASQPAVVNMEDCTDNNPDCSSPEKLTRINNLSVQKVEVNLDTRETVNTIQVCVPFVGCHSENVTIPEPSAGNIWLDTDNVPLSGQIQSIDNVGPVDITVNLPNGFRAQDRFVRWRNFIPVETSGTVTCPSGTDLDVTLFDTITVDVSGLYLC